MTDIQAAIVALDSAASWCRHRHEMPDDVKRNVDHALGVVRRFDLFAISNDVVDEAKDLCWKATPYGRTADGDVLSYIVPKGTVHRLVGALQCAGVPAALRNPEWDCGADEQDLHVIVRRVRILHQAHQDLPGGKKWCGECRGDWPCVTALAVDPRAGSEPDPFAPVILGDGHL